MSFRFRPGTPRDGPDCARIIRAWGAETPWMAPLDDAGPMGAYWAEMIGEHPTWVAESDGAVVGFCLREDDTNNIGGLYLARDARGQGVGRRLLDQARAGCDRVVVWAYEANVPARRFYARAGFVEVGRAIEEGSNLLNVAHIWTRLA